MISVPPEMVRRILAFGKRGAAVTTAFAVGWVVYMIAMFLTVYEGFPSLILQPLVAILVSGFVVAISMLVGLLFWIPAVGRIWRATRLTAAFLIFASLFTLCCGSLLGFTETFTHPEHGGPVTVLKPELALWGYLSLLFAITNWPFGGNIRLDWHPYPTNR